VWNGSSSSKYGYRLILVDTVTDLRLKKGGTLVYWVCKMTLMLYGFREKKANKLGITKALMKEELI
jgi:hypothetical protein